MLKLRIYCTFLLLFLTGYCSSAQKNNFVVYAGVKASAGTGAMNRTDVAMLLRNDGTFTDKLGEQNWRTAVKGKYTQTATKLTLNYAGKKAVIYNVTKKGNLSRRGQILSKFSKPNIPKGGFEYKKSSGNGGMGTNQDYVGSSSSKYFYFDDRNRFTTKQSSNTTVVGSQVGGGTGKKSTDSGTYSLVNGELTLKFDNGSTKKYSCFVSRPVGKDGDMLLINGSFYFRKN